MSGFPARSTSRQKRSGNAAALLARKVDRAGNETAKLITFTLHLQSAADAELVAEQKWHRVFRLTSRSQISRISSNMSIDNMGLLFMVIISHYKIECGK